MVRRMGVPAAAIVDLDMLAEGNFAALLRAANVPRSTCDGIAGAKSRLLGSLEGKDLKLRGIDGMPEKGSSEDLLAALATYGVFLVPTGEVENWLRSLGVPGHGPKWLNRMFERLGSDPAEQNYVRPDDQDVWRFLREVGRWLRNPDRKGMPAVSGGDQ
jgi:hypothetical protein